MSGEKRKKQQEHKKKRRFLLRDRLALLVDLLDERLVNVRNDTAMSDVALEEIVQLLVASDGEAQMTRRDAFHLEILGGVAGQLQDLCTQILEHRCEINGRVGSNAIANESECEGKEINDEREER
jgi:hypothetical protein